MFTQRAAQQSLRRLAASNPSMVSRMAMKNFVAPIAIGATMQTRPVATQKLNPTESLQILIEQRKRRPVSPHLMIYKPQITWILSSLNRITGSILSGGFYVFGAAYLVAPVLGWHLDSATMAAAFGSLPLLVKVAAKFAVSLPFTFHSLNGVRHLVWDLAFNFKNASVVTTGWAVVGLSVASSVALATLW